MNKIYVYASTEIVSIVWEMGVSDLCMLFVFRPMLLRSMRIVGLIVTECRFSLCIRWLAYK